MYLELRGIRKTFDASVALQDIDLSVGEHEFVCLLGPSGCGKTT
jgi:iron(III) transport system ATP-binding protein